MLSKPLRRLQSGQDRALFAQRERGIVTMDFDTCHDIANEAEPGLILLQMQPGVIGDALMQGVALQANTFQQAG